MKIVTRSAEQTIALGEKLGALLGLSLIHI